VTCVGVSCGSCAPVVRVLCGCCWQALRARAENWWGNSAVLESGPAQWCAVLGVLSLQLAWVFLGYHRWELWGDG
jgi:hypothetical protein